MNPNQGHLMGIGPYGTVHKRSSSIPRRLPYGNIPKGANNKQNSFCLMDVSVTILNLNGILMSSKKKEKRFHDPHSGFNGSTDSGGTPVTAVVSFSKNVTSSQTSIASHFPSLPIQASAQYTNSNKHRFLASWPKDYDEMGNKLCTFQFTRMMRQEYVSDRYSRSSKSSIYVPERVKLTIGLTKGSEIINIGSSSIVLMGDESQNVQMNLPVSLEKSDSNIDDSPGISRTKSNSSFFAKNVKSYKPTSFSKDPQRKFSMDQNACLKVLVNVRPSASNAQSGYSNEMSHGMYVVDMVPGTLRSSSGVDSGNRGVSRSESRSRSRNGRSSICLSGSDSNGGGRENNPPYLSQSIHDMNHFQQEMNEGNYFEPKLNENNHWVAKSNADERSYSSVSDDGDKTSSPFFCGALFDLMNMNQNSNQSKTMSSFKSLQRKARRRSMDLGFDADSIIPTHRKNDDNESQFIPPSKVYARSYSAEDDSNENAYAMNDTAFSEEDESQYCQSRQDYHSVATEKINNKNVYKEMEQTRASYANRIGINPDTMI